jgi:hypothetical protein
MFLILLLVLMFFALVAQHFLGAFPGMGGQILLLPVVFFYAAAALPLWGMLASALLAGFMWDCLTVVPVDGRTEIAFGTSILVYGALGAVMNGLHPLFVRGRWQPHCLLTGVLTSALVLVEFVMVTFRREPFAFIWPREVWSRILSSGIAAAMIAPELFFSLNAIARRLGHFERERQVAAE